MIQPIKTPYKGMEFRSRLEARWAVFFDYLGVVYQYEVEGFDIDGTWYVPDFYLPDYSCWLEMKPKKFIWWENEKVLVFKDQIDDKFCVVCGVPQFDQYAVHLLANPNWTKEANDFRANFLGARGSFDLSRRSECNELCFVGRKKDIGIAFNLIDNPSMNGESMSNFFYLDRVASNAEILAKAYNFAMAYRFEESPVFH